MRIASVRMGIRESMIFLDRSVEEHSGKHWNDMRLIGASPMIQDIFELGFVEQVLIDQEFPSVVLVKFIPGHENIEQMSRDVGEQIACTLDGHSVLEWLDPEEVHLNYAARCQTGQHETPDD